MITLTDIRQYGSAKDRRELKNLRSAKKRTANANVIVNSPQFEKFNAHDAEHYGTAQDRASEDYSKAFDSFVCHFQISDDEGCEIANKIRCKQ